MKNKQSIEQLKDEGLVTTADKIPKIEVLQRNMLESINEYDSDTKYMGMWLYDFLKRYKLKFEDFSIDVETIYSQNKTGKLKKGTKTPKTEENASNDTGSTKKDRSNWFNDYKNKKLGL